MVHYKKNKLSFNCIIIFCFISCTQALCQDREFERIDFFQTSHSLSDNLIENKSKESTAEGSIYRRTFLFFRKKIGTSNSIITHNDTLILSIVKTKQYSNEVKVVSETYSFHNNVLSKYTQLVDTGVDSAQVSKIYRQHFTNDNVTFKSLMTIHGESEPETKLRFEKVKNNIENEFRRYLDYIKMLRFAY